MDENGGEQTEARRGRAPPEHPDAPGTPGPPDPDGDAPPAPSGRAEFPKLIRALQARLGSLGWDDLTGEERRALFDLLEAVQALIPPEWADPEADGGEP